MSKKQNQNTQEKDTNTQEKENKIKTFVNNVLLNKKMLLLAEVLLCIFFGVFFVLGIRDGNIIMEAFCSNCFTAFFVALLTTVIKWKHEDEEEQAAKFMQQKFDEYETHNQRLNDQIDELSKAMTIYRGKECIFCKSYVKGVKPNRDECNLWQFFDSAQHEISILVANLKSLTPYEDQLRAIANRGVKVRILTMHPEFAVKFGQTRALGKTLSPKQNWLSMKTALELYLQPEPQGNFQVRVYNKLSPTLILFIVDNSCYVAHMLNNKEAKETPHYLFGETHDSADGNSSADSISPVSAFKDHFDVAWNHEGTSVVKYSDIESLPVPDEYADK